MQQTAVESAYLNTNPYIFSESVLSADPSRVQYFMPNWDDTVDTMYATLQTAIGARRNQQGFAHQLYQRPYYDGVLVSRAFVEENARRKQRIRVAKAHAYFRVPRAFTIMGDSGAFSYLNEPSPPYNTDDMLTYYTELDVDLGVSLDHLWFGGRNHQEQQQRVELSLTNAADFKAEHRRRQLSWTPVGAIQGWDVPSFVRSAQQVVKMGYDYVGLGGVIRMSNATLIAILEAVRQAIPADVRLHVFGVARPNIMGDYKRLRVTSADSAAPLRRAFMDVKGSYFTLEDHFATFSIPRADTISHTASTTTPAQALHVAEAHALQAVQEWDNDQLSVSATLDALLTYQNLLRPTAPSLKHLYRRTLQARPHRQCTCVLCQQLKADILIMRDRNRNQRRAFHNTYVWYTLIQHILDDKPVSEAWVKSLPRQLTLSLNDYPITTEQDTP